MTRLPPETLSSIVPLKVSELLEVNASVPSMAPFLPSIVRPVSKMVASLLLTEYIRLPVLPPKTMSPPPPMVWLPGMATLPLWTPAESPMSNFPSTVRLFITVSVLPFSAASMTCTLPPEAIVTLSNVKSPI